jgi:hypothetical protein
VELKRNGTHQLLVYTDDINLLGDDTSTIKTKNGKTKIDVSKEVGLQVNMEKIKYMLVFHHLNTGQNHDIKIGSRSFENVAQFRYVYRNESNKSKFDSCGNLNVIEFG